VLGLTASFLYVVGTKAVAGASNWYGCFVMMVSLTSPPADNYWQTETGSPILCNYFSLVGYSLLAQPLSFSALNTGRSSSGCTSHGLVWLAYARLRLPSARPRS
jgi:hypothetical protein